MLKSTIFFASLSISTLLAQNCSPYYNPDKFYEAPEYLDEIIENNINKFGLELFGTEQNYKKLSFKKLGNSFINQYKQLKEYKYPIKNGIFEYKIKNKEVDELSISQVELYKYTDISIAEEINGNFEEFWSDWIENNYEMKLIPEQVLFRYQEKYFSFSVYIYGIEGDGTNLKGSVVKYWFKNYTKEVNQYIICMNNNM